MSLSTIKAIDRFRKRIIQCSSLELKDDAVTDKELLIILLVCEGWSLNSEEEC